METDIKVLTELADKILKQADIQIRYNGIFNLQNKIGQDFNHIFDACQELISENSRLRFNSYLINYYNINSNHNFANKCLRLCMNHSDRLTEYENEPDEKRIERMQRLNQYDGIISIGKKSPDSIYCENGSYRIFNEVCRSFEYRLCREIQKSDINNDELKTVFQIVCLDLALRNEQRVTEEEAALLGIPLRQKQELIKSSDKENYKQQTIENFKKQLKTSPVYNSVISIGKMNRDFIWCSTKIELKRWLVDNKLLPQKKSHLGHPYWPADKEQGNLDWECIDQVFTWERKGRKFSYKEIRDAT